MSDRVVFDCMIYLQAASRPWRTHGCFEAVERGELELFISHEIIAEVADVLSRKEIRRRFPALTDDVVKLFLAKMLSLSTMIEHVASSFLLPRDPKDEKYLNLAIAVGAKFLVSSDNDLLSLMDESDQTGAELMRRFPGIRIVKAGELIHELEIRRSDN